MEPPADIQTLLPPPPPLLSVVVPAFNEEATLREIIARLLADTAAGEIVIVDDCSTDATPAIADQLAAEHPQVRVAHHAVNAGKTEALKTGFALTTGQIVIVQDADLEYDPAEIADVIAPIVEGHADVVYGSRFLVRKASRVLYFYHYIANKTLTFLSNLCTNVNMTDVETCYKAFRGDIIRNMTITSRGFGFEIEVTAKTAKLQCAIYEVPISYHGRTYEQGKKIGLKDGIAALWYILRFNFFCRLQDSFRVLPEAGREQRGAHKKKSAISSLSSSRMTLLAILFFMAAASFFIPRIGPEEDEVLFVPAIYNPSIASTLKLGAHRYPVMLIDYIGADKIYLYAPILKYFRPNLWTLRVPMVLIGALGLWFLFCAFRRFATDAIAVALIWIMASDSLFLLLTTMDWGPVAVQHFCVFLALALFAQRKPQIFAGCAALGFALWSKGTALWILAAMGASAVVFLWKPLRPLITRHNIARAVGGFILGALPFLAFNVKNHWVTFGGNAHFTTDAFVSKLWVMVAMLTGKGLFAAMVRGAPPVWSSLLPVALVAAVALLFHPRAAPIRRTALFALSTGLLTWAGMLFAQNGGTSAHHDILVWPWPQIFVVCVLGYALPKRAFQLAAVALVASNIVMTGWYVERTLRLGPTSGWSEASLQMLDLLPANGPVTSIEWGISNIASYLSAGKYPTRDITFSGLTPDDIPELDRTVFLAHVPGEEMTDGANARFDAAIAKLGYTRVVDRVISDNRGRPFIESFHCARLSTALSP